MQYSRFYFKLDRRTTVSVVYIASVINQTTQNDTSNSLCLYWQ